MSVWSTIVQAGAKLVADNKNGILKGARNFLGSYFSSFKQGGFRCLGKQAFNQNDLNVEYDKFNSRVSKVKEDDPHDIASFLTYASAEAAQSRVEVEKYRSKCSKDNRRQLAETIERVISEFLSKSNLKFKKERRSYSDYSGVTVHHDAYVFEGVGLGTEVQVKPIEKTPENDNKDLLSGILLDDYGNIDPSLYTPGFIAPEDLADRLTTNASPTWSVGAGGKTADGVDWNIGAGKTNQDNTTKYLVLGLMGLVAYKLLFDRK